MSEAMKQTALKSGLIDINYHERLVADMHGVLQQAGVPENYIWTSMHKYCDDVEVGYVTDIKKYASQEDPIFGMVYVHKINGAPVNDRMLAIAGACLRQYINAKVMTLQEVLGSLKTSDMPSPTVLLIPNFFLSKSDGGRIAEWEVSSLLGLLYKRHQEGKQTVLYVGDWDGMRADYGQVFADHLGEGKFVQVTAGMTKDRTK